MATANAKSTTEQCGRSVGRDAATHLTWPPDSLADTLTCAMLLNLSPSPAAPARGTVHLRYPVTLRLHCVTAAGQNRARQPTTRAPSMENRGHALTRQPTMRFWRLSVHCHTGRMPQNPQSSRNRAAALRTRSQELRRIAAVQIKESADIRKAARGAKGAKRKDPTGTPPKPKAR
jgi:hypothetical protein